MIAKGNESDLAIDLGDCRVLANVASASTFAARSSTCSMANRCGGSVHFNLEASDGEVAGGLLNWKVTGTFDATCPGRSPLSGSFRWQVDGKR